MPKQGNTKKSSEPHGQFVDLYMMNYLNYTLLTMSTSIMIRTLMYPHLHMTILEQAQRERDMKAKSVQKRVFDTHLVICKETGKIRDYGRQWKINLGGGNERIFGSLWDVLKREGIYGVYRGASFRVCGQALSSLVYLNGYERMREFMDKEKKKDWHVFIAGAVAPIPSNCIVAPFEIVNQHVVLLSKKPKTQQEARILKGLQAFRVAKEIRHSRSWWSLEIAVFKEIKRTNGYSGLWRSFYFTLPYYCFSSGLFWFLLTKYSDVINTLFPGLKHQQILPDKTRMIINTMSGVLSSISVTLITNPANIIKTRSQLGHVNIREAFLSICRQEKWTAFFVKGLVPRLIYSVPFAFFGVLGYENVKEFSVKKEYERIVKW